MQFVNPARIIHTDAKQKSAKQQSLLQSELDRESQELKAAPQEKVSLPIKSKSPTKMEQHPARRRVLSKRGSGKNLRSIDTQTKQDGGNGTGQPARLNNNSRASVQNLKLKKNGQVKKCQSRSQISI